MEETEENEETQKFQVNRNLIESVLKENQAEELLELDVAVYDQRILEKGIIDQVKDALHQDDSYDDSFTENNLQNILEHPSDFEEGEIAGTSECQETTRNKVAEGPERDAVSEIERYIRRQLELTEKKRKAHTQAASASSPVKPVKNQSRPSEWDKNYCGQNKKRNFSSKKNNRKENSTAKKSKQQSETDDEYAEEAKVYRQPASGSEYYPSEEEQHDSDIEMHVSTKKKFDVKKNVPRNIIDSDDSDWASSGDENQNRRGKKEMDDGDLDLFVRRCKSLKSHKKQPFEKIDHDFMVPKNIWDKLFQYQRDGVRWLWKLHMENSGGILGDEMGLGKTIQMISFLAGLHFSDKMDDESRYHGLGPTIIICPTTIMHQWVREFHNWYPYIRVAILHESGSFTGKKRSLIKSIHSKTAGVLITSYSGLLQFSEAILSLSWHYVILDEGHKIRNPEAQITTAAKSFMCTHRIILSGSPMQNNLSELWSLFDFILPGKLGTLAVFSASFASPIVLGGYVNASKTQVVTAFKCATALRDTINPYLLRRSKCEVDIRLPNKTEQVLFCKLTAAQREVYKDYLNRVDVDDLLRGKTRLFAALSVLRKICNHPDLYTGGPNRDFVMTDKSVKEDEESESDFGYWKRSGKMIVLNSLLHHWYKTKQRVLLFTQGKKMLMLTENLIKRRGYKYLRLDGGTSIAARQPLIDKFNRDPSYFVMVLTTRVGGLGVNLTGANKVVIYDPDWNPATDVQARERAWRIGQSKQVTIFRLITGGTIEEKIYHRQIFKQFLSNKVLKDPKQRRFFKANSLMELLSLNETIDGGTNETAAIFAGTGSEVKYDPKSISKSKESKESEISNKYIKVTFSQKQLDDMKKLAQEVSKKLFAPKNDANGQGELNETERNDKEKEDKKSRTNEEELELSGEPLYGPDGNLIPSRVEKGVVEAPLRNFSESINSSSEVAESKTTSLDIPPTVSNISEHNNNSIKEGRGVTNSKEGSLKGKDKSPKKALSYEYVRERKDTSKNNMSRKRKLKTKEKSPKKFAKFEGEVISHLIKCKRVKKKSKEKEEKSNQDDYILQKLLKKSGIETAMKHDTIMDVGPSDYVLVEEEASKVAQEALEAIKRSSAHVSGPVFSSEIKNELTRQIMERIKSRNLQSTTGTPQIQALLRDIISWLNSHGGTASTQQLVSEFRHKVEEGKSAVFKMLLKNIATFYRGPDNIGYWTIKEEFR